MGSVPSSVSQSKMTGGKRNTNTFIITFKTASIPKHLKIGYIRVSVLVYTPNPLRCCKCQKFGHGQKACRVRETYATCGQAGHNNDRCSNELKCANCTGNHSAFSKSCPKWIFEKHDAIVTVNTAAKTSEKVLKWR